MEKFKIANLIKNLGKIAIKNNWIKTYNKKLDYFCWSKANLSKDIREIKISQEVLLYLNRKKVIEGFGVEYLKNNFIEHNPRYENLTKFFTEETNEGIFTIPPKQEKKVAGEFEAFVEVLTKDIYQDNWENERTSKDLEKLLSVATK